eukprot:127262-Lingulodinium_polyedra.AAC.1
MVSPTYGTAKQLNKLLAKTKQNRILNGLHFKQLGFPLKIVGISDAGHATKASVYAQEGRFCLLMQDRPRLGELGEWEDNADLFSGGAHP